MPDMADHSGSRQSTQPGKARANTTNASTPNTILTSTPYQTAPAARSIRPSRETCMLRVVGRTTATTSQLTPATNNVEANAHSRYGPPDGNWTATARNVTACVPTTTVMKRGNSGRLGRLATDRRGPAGALIAASEPTRSPRRSKGSARVPTRLPKPCTFQFSLLHETFIDTQSLAECLPPAHVAHVQS